MLPFKNQLLIFAWFYIIFINLVYGQTVDIELYSTGFDQTKPSGWYSFITLDGSQNLIEGYLSTNWHPIGHNVVVINEITGALIDSQNFDTYYDSNADNDLVNYLNNIASTSIHRIIAIVTFDSVQYQTNTYPLLSSWNGCSTGQPAHRESWLWLGTPSDTYNPSWQYCQVDPSNGTSSYHSATIPLFQTNAPTALPTSMPFTNIPTNYNSPTTYTPTTNTPTTYTPTTQEHTTGSPTTFMPSTNPTTSLPTTSQPTSVPTTNTPTSYIPTYLPSNIPTLIPIATFTTNGIQSTTQPTISTTATSTVFRSLTSTVYLTLARESTSVETTEHAVQIDETKTSIKSIDEYRESSGIDLTMLIGIIIGCICLCVIFGIFMLYLSRKRKKSDNDQNIKISHNLHGVHGVSIPANSPVSSAQPTMNSFNGLTDFENNLSSVMVGNNMLMSDIMNEMNGNMQSHNDITAGGPDVDVSQDDINNYNTTNDDGSGEGGHKRTPSTQSINDDDDDEILIEMTGMNTVAVKTTKLPPPPPPKHKHVQEQQQAVYIDYDDDDVINDMNNQCVGQTKGNFNQYPYGSGDINKVMGTKGNFNQNEYDISFGEFIVGHDDKHEGSNQNTTANGDINDDDDVLVYDNQYVTNNGDNDNDNQNDVGWYQ